MPRHSTAQAIAAAHGIVVCPAMTAMRRDDAARLLRCDTGRDFG